MLPSVNALRTLLVHATLALTLAVTAAAQDKIIVSPTTKAGNDIVTIRYTDENGENPEETLTYTVNVALTKGLSGPEKAKIVAEAIKSDKVKAAVDATYTNQITITPAAGVKIRSSKLTGASGEKRDGVAVKGPAVKKFATTSLGALEFVDGYGDLSTFTIGTARGEVELTLLDYGSVESAMLEAVWQLQDFGIDAWMSDDSTIEFFADEEFDQVVYFGCTDAGVVQISELSSICDDCGD